MSGKHYVYASYNYYYGSRHKTIKLLGVFSDPNEAHKLLREELQSQLEYEDQNCWIQGEPYIEQEHDRNE